MRLTRGKKGKERKSEEGKRMGGKGMKGKGKERNKEGMERDRK